MHSIAQDETKCDIIYNNIMSSVWHIMLQVKMFKGTCNNPVSRKKNASLRIYLTFMGLT